MWKHKPHVASKTEIKVRRKFWTLPFSFHQMLFEFIPSQCLLLKRKLYNSFAIGFATTWMNCDLSYEHIEIAIN